MYKWMQKNSKKMLAVFAALLMVVFILPSDCKRGAGRSDQALGHIGKDEVTVSDVLAYFREWAMLRDRIFVQQPNPYTGQPTNVPLAYRVLDQEAVQQISTERNRAMFYLLVREARDRGVRVPVNELDQNLQAVKVKLDDASVMDFTSLSEDSEIAASVRRAVTDLMMVQFAYDQAGSIVKVSQPLLNNQMARELQRIKLQLIEFAASDYLSKAPPPTTQAVTEQFNKYADVLSADFNPLSNDPFGFGYKYPDRVKLQYIAVPRDQVRQAVRSAPPPRAAAANAGKKLTPADIDYLWEVEARRYYRDNPDQFTASTPPTPTTRGAATQVASASSQPTTQPFEQVREVALQRVVDPEVDRLANAIQSRITSSLTAGWQQYRAAHPNAGAASASGAYAAGANAGGAIAGGTSAGGANAGGAIAGGASTGGASTGGATSAPATGPAAGYPSFEFLKNLAADVQREFKVLPTTASFDEKFLDAKQLATLPNIGTAAATTANQRLPFALYASTFVAAFRPSEESLALFQPSRPLIGEDQSIYTIRITAADPAHRPTSIDEVRPQVEQDVRTKAAYDLAMQAARDAAKAVQSSGSSSGSAIRNVAMATGKTAIATDFFDTNTANSARLIPGYAVSAASIPAFTSGAYNLLAVAAKNPAAPAVTVIELPRDRKAVVAQLADVQLQPGLSPQVMQFVQSESVKSVVRELREPLTREWFDYDHVVARTNFIDATRRTPSNNNATANANTPG